MISPSDGKNLKFQSATLKEASELVELHNSYYGTARKTEDWLWEYQTYEPGKSVFSFAKDLNKIIATQGMLPIYTEVGPKIILSGKSESTLVLPAYRGSQIMRNLYEYSARICLEHGMQFLWGFTPAIKAFKNFGFESYPNIQKLVRPGNILAGIKLKLKQNFSWWRRFVSIGELFVRHFSLGRNAAFSQFHENSEYKLKKGITDEICLKKLFDRLKLQNPNAIFIRYDNKYLKWRVREHPFIKYFEYQVYLHADLKAYAIVTLFKGITSISDLTSEDENATSFLLHKIIEDFSKKTAEFQFLINTQDILSLGVLRQLSGYGFSVGSSVNLVVRDLTKGDNKEIFDIRNWHINGLWTEGYSM